MLFFYNIDILCMQKLSVYCMNMSFSDSSVYPKIFYFQLLLSKCTIPQQAAGMNPNMIIKNVPGCSYLRHTSSSRENALPRSLSHPAAHASLGILKSPLGDSATVPTFGPSARQDLLNC